LQHANLRARTPAFVDRLVCTPVVHRWHHSRAHRESDANFGTFVMIFDALFGTWSRPTRDAPEAFGLEDDPVRRGFLRQLLDPFGRPSDR
jgi:sterol desaturase/sphingolipid hydroxylase (fatty acid hydroxylase superfamily)